MATEFARMAQIYGTSADWDANDIILLNGEIGLELTLSGVVFAKAGDGVSTYSLLPYMIGEYVDLINDQTVGGIKTFTGDVRFLNNADPTKFGRVYAGDFQSKPVLFVDANDIDSSLALQNRDGAGNSLTLFLSSDGSLYYRGRVIADASGLAGYDWGRFDAAGLLTAGVGFTVARLALGQYEITFTQPADSPGNQAITASIEGPSGSLATTSTAIIDATTIQVHTTDGSIVADQAVNFYRGYTSIINVAASL
jgi:hypothetical protein